MSVLAKLYDADHQTSIEVDYQDIRDDTVALDAHDFLGIQVITGNQNVARVFEVDVQPQEVCQKAHLQAIKDGNHVFFIEYGLHSTVAFRICDKYPPRDWDSACAGIIIVPRDRWFNAKPKTTYARRYVLQVLKELFDDRVTHTINGDIFELFFNDGKDGTESLGYLGFLTVEDALAYGKEEYPQCRFAEEDFDVVRTYSLKPNTACQMN